MTASSIPASMSPRLRSVLLAVAYFAVCLVIAFGLVTFVFAVLGAITGVALAYMTYGTESFPEYMELAEFYVWASFLAPGLLVVAHRCLGYVKNLGACE